jgi:hypothetical protein
MRDGMGGSSHPVEPGWIGLSPPRCRRWHTCSWWADQTRRLDLGRLLGAGARFVFNRPQGM